MSVTLNVTTSRFRSAVAGAGISAEVVPLTSVLVMVASIDSLSAPASRLTARLAPVGSLARNTPALLIALLMIAVVGTLAWEFQVSLPLMASKVFHGGAGSYGVMASVMGGGAVVGGLISAARARPRARALCLAAIGWGIAILAAAAAPSFALELAALVFVGYGSITFNSLAKTTLQLAAKPEMRGRVMALWALAWMGSTPIGGPIVGWVGQVTGPRWALVVGGLPTLVCEIGRASCRERV